jgi:hypothetical protein
MLVIDAGTKIALPPLAFSLREATANAERQASLARWCQHLGHARRQRSNPSMLKSLSITTVLLAFGALSAPALAAPASGLKGIEAATTSSLTEQVGYRRCWWRYGHRHCRWVGGYGPSINLHFGERHGHRHYRRYHRY